MSISDILSVLALFVSLIALRDARKSERTSRRLYLAEQRENGLIRVRELADELGTLRRSYESVVKASRECGKTTESFPEALQQCLNLLNAGDAAVRNSRDALSDSSVLCQDAVKILEVNRGIDDSRHTLTKLSALLDGIRSKLETIRDIRAF